MTFDEQHGWVERGTRGHHASAQGVDVDAEVAALDRMHARPLTSPHRARGTTPPQAEVAHANH